MTAVLKKELKGYYTSLFTYVYYGLFFLMLGVLFVRDCLNSYNTGFGYYVLSSAFVVVLVIAPLYTMRLLAQEKKNRTDQLLFTAPVSKMSVIAGKFLAAAIVLFVPIVLSIGYPIYIAGCGEMSVRFLAGSYLAVSLVVLVLLAFGMFVSALTSNTVLAVIVTYAVYLIVILGRIVENFVPVEWIYQLFRRFSVYNIYYAMVSGIVRSGDVLYLLFLTILFFVLTWFVEEKQRLGNRRWIAGIGVSVIVFGIVTMIGMQTTKIFDLTAEQLLTFSDETKQLAADIKKETDIYYLGDRSRANATYQELMAQYHKLNSKIRVHYVNAQSDSEFRNKYLADVSDISETSMVVVCGEKYVYLDANRYITTLQTSQYSYKSTLEVENQLTSAICYVNSEESKKIYYLTGHGETQLATGFSNMLRMNDYQLEELDIASKLNSVEATIPEDCKALLIEAPESDLSEDEITALEEYMDDGGKIFVSIDPLNEDLEHFDGFLKKYGFQLQQGVVIEGSPDNYVYDTAYYLQPKIESHAITKELEKDSLPVLTMTSKGIYKEGSANGYQCTDLLVTTAKAFSKVADFDDVTIKGTDDVGGPFSVASISEKKDGGKMLLLTSNIFFQDEVDTESSGGNRRFFLSAINYLTGNEDSGIMIPGKTVGDQVALYPNETQTFVRIFTIVLIPVLLLLIGIVVVICYRKNVIVHMHRKNQKKDEQDETVES